jgi:hypothetical protein
VPKRNNLLAPASRDHIPVSYYSVIQDVSNIGNMNWTLFFKERCCKPEGGIHPK